MCLYTQDDKTLITTKSVKIMKSSVDMTMDKYNPESTFMGNTVNNSLRLKLVVKSSK